MYITAMTSTLTVAPRKRAKRAIATNEIEAVEQRAGEAQCPPPANGRIIAPASIATKVNIGTPKMNPTATAKMKPNKPE